MAWVRNRWHPEAWTWIGAELPPETEWAERLATSKRLRWLAPANRQPPVGWHLQRRTVLACVAVARQAPLPRPGRWRIEPPTTDLLGLVHRHYVRCHRANPLRRLDPGGRRRVFAPIDLCAVRRDNGRLVAGVTLHIEPPVLAVGWTFGVSDTLVRGWAPLLHATAAQRGARWLCLEVDSDDLSARVLSREVRHQRRDVWGTWLNEQTAVAA